MVKNVTDITLAFYCTRAQLRTHKHTQTHIRLAICHILRSVPPRSITGTRADMVEASAIKVPRSVQGEDR